MKEQKSIHLEKFLNFPESFKNEKLNQKWIELIKIRNLCNVSIEEKRAAKEIGSSLEAGITIYLDENLKEIIKNIDFSELCITSNAKIIYEKNSDIKVLTEKAKGSKCSICWKINENGCARSNCPKSS